MLLLPVGAASEPTVYHVCGVREVGRPTIEQLICIAEAIGAPNDPEFRVVRQGFNATFAEPTLEILHRLRREIAGGGTIVWNLKIELSEIDGQLLYYGPAFEALPERSGLADSQLTRQSIRGSRHAPTLEGLCPTDTSPLTSERLQCMARALGISEGKSDWRVREEATSSAAEPVWTLKNTIEDTPCQAHGTFLSVAVADARILRYGLWKMSCAHGPVPRRPITRTMRQP